jgi:hypothetical protein
MKTPDPSPDPVAEPPQAAPPSDAEVAEDARALEAIDAIAAFVRGSLARGPSAATLAALLLEVLPDPTTYDATEPEPPPRSRKHRRDNRLH